MADDEQLFRGTCDVFELRTCNDVGVLGVQFIDPCSCYSYYKCINTYEMLHQTCAGGTAWDYKDKSCKHFQAVTFNQNCSEETNAWTRCNVTDSRLEELKLFCTNTTTTAPTSTIPPTTASPASASRINPGVIVGSIIGGAVIAVIVLIVAFYVYRRHNSINKKRPGTIAHNPEYFEGGIPDDPYAVINDDHVTRDVGMTDPTYNGSTLGGTMSQSSGMFTNAGFDDTGEDAVYDNSGARTVSSGYTSTIRRSVREYETSTGAHSSRENIQSGGPVSHLLATSQSDEQRGGNVYVDLNGNNNKNSENSEHGGTEMQPSVLESSSEHTAGHSDENMPDYFVLEKSEDHL